VTRRPGRATIDRDRVTIAGMRRQGEDTFAMKRRRMPFDAKIKRDDPFRVADRREINDMVRRIAAAGEHFSIAGWREKAGYLLFHFPTWAKTRAMQHWIDRSGIAGRPMPVPFNGRRCAWGNSVATDCRQCWASEKLTRA
jgi:hypothetical protein